MHIYAEIDVLLTLEQYREAVPSTLVSYLSYGSLIFYEHTAIPLLDIIGIHQNPLSVLQWDASNGHLSPLSQEVIT